MHKPPAKTWLKYLLFIGLLACILFLVSRMFSGSGSGSNKDLVASYYKPMPLQLSEKATVKPQFKTMATMYNDKLYADVIPILNGFLQTKPDVKWNLYRGIAYYETGDLVKAEEDFSLLANSANQYLAEHGTWYQALCALKIGDADLAKELLQKLAVKPQGNYMTKAKEVLGKL